MPFKLVIFLKQCQRSLSRRNGVVQTGKMKSPAKSTTPSLFHLASEKPQQNPTFCQTRTKLFINSDLSFLRSQLFNSAKSTRLSSSSIKCPRRNRHPTDLEHSETDLSCLLILNPVHHSLQKPLTFLFLIDSVSFSFATMEDCKPPSSLSSKKPKKLDSEGPYRLLFCSSKGDKAGVMQELEKGVAPNLGDYDKRTALHLASCEGCTEIVVLLLQKGADVNCTDRWGRTPLSDARSFGHGGICKILEAKGGIDPVGLDSQLPCYEIHHNEVNMDEATLIGEGAYGEIYLVKWRGTEIAAKTIRSSIASKPTVKTLFLKELALWQQLRHPNIVQFLGVLKHPDRLIFLTEFLCNGSLHDILKRKGKLDLQTVVRYALDIARGMNYLHQHKPRAIIHRDLTPRNVLQDEAGRLKVTDFGLSKIAQHNDVSGYKMTGRTGSYRYMAPEVYRRESYGKSIDIFSFALIVHEMFLGGPSNLAEDPEQIADKRAYEDSRPPLYSYLYPEPIRTLLKECWHPNPDCRPTFEEIILQLESIQDNFPDKKRLGTCISRCVIS